MQSIGIINGPNLGRLGKREPEVYGSASLVDLESQIRTESEKLKIDVCFFQSNHEGAIIDTIEQWADDGVEGIIINPGAFTHTSVALHDAMAASTSDFLEVHISNIYQREEFRHKSLTAPQTIGVISGLGFDGYIAALRYLAEV